MNGKTAIIHLAAYREGGPLEPRLTKALKAIENDSLLREKLAEQVTFDTGVGEMLSALTPPSDLRDRLEKVEVPPATKRPRENLTAILAVIVGLLAIIGIFVFLQWEGRQNFPGREALQRLLITGSSPRTAAEMEIVGNQAGQLGDWFYMRGFDFFQLPADLQKVPALGSRIFRQEGRMVGQVAIEPHQSLVYIFKGEEFGVQLPSATEWSFFEAEGWAAAARQCETSHVMISFRGSGEEMRDFVNTLSPHSSAYSTP